MTVSVHQAQPRDELGDIAKALNIATTIYKIKMDNDQTKAAQELAAQKDTKLQAKETNDQAALSKKEMEAERSTRQNFSSKHTPITQKEYDDLKREGLQLPLVAQEDAPSGLKLPGDSIGYTDASMIHKYRTAKEAGKNKSGSGSTDEYKSLPRENRIEIDSIAKQNSNKRTIETQLAGFQEQYNDAIAKGNTDLAITIGNSMIKTLNSTQGADAVSNEEAQRLAGYLKYNMMNFTDPGAFHGRDLEGFNSQVSAIRKSISSAIEANSKNIDQLYGRKSPNKKEPELTPQQIAAQELMEEMNAAKNTAGR
jgi:hypothetical protein